VVARTGRVCRGAWPTEVIRPVLVGPEHPSHDKSPPDPSAQALTDIQSLHSYKSPAEITRAKTPIQQQPLPGRASAGVGIRSSSVQSRVCQAGSGGQNSRRGSKSFESGVFVEGGGRERLGRVAEEEFERSAGLDVAQNL